MRKISLALAALVLVLALAIAMAPWKTLVENKLRTELAARGFAVEFSVDSLNAKGIVLTDIRWKEAADLKLNKLTVDYSLFKLLHGEINQLSASELWVTVGSVKALLKNVSVVFEPSATAGAWHGSWTVASVEAQNLPTPVAPLAGGGRFSAQPGKAEVEGALGSADKRTSLAFKVHYPENMLITEATLPWNEGMLSTRDAQFSFSPQKSSQILLRVENVSLNALLKLLTGERARATGVVSGHIPVTFANGDFSVDRGSLNTQASGTVIVAPDAIPGEGDQVGMVRDILKNFHYTQLSLGLDSGKDKKLSMLLQLSGNNPDVYNGREVKLNVHLTGDLVPLVTQTILPSADPGEWLKQEEK